MKLIPVLILLLSLACCKKDDKGKVDGKNNDSISKSGNQDSIISSGTLPDTISEGEDTIVIKPSTRKHFLYVSLNNKKEIAVFKLDTTTGNLNSIENISVNGSPGSLAFSTNQEYLYAALRSSNQVASFKIDKQTGKLRFIKNTSVAGNPVYISPDKTNKYLLTAYWSENIIAIYPIKGDSIIENKATQQFNPGVNPHCILNSGSNSYTYAAVMTSGNVNQYSFDDGTGKLTGLNPENVALGKDVGPRHISFHPNGKWVYIVNEINNTVNAYEINQTDGTLSIIDNINTLPASFTEFSKTADIHVTPNGKYVYASNRGHNSIVGYKINQTDGKLELINQYETEPYPREFEIDVTGKFLFSGGEDSGKIAAYKINEDGTLTAHKTYTPGIKIAWLLSGAF